MTDDSPEQIKICLACKYPDCITPCPYTTGGVVKPRKKHTGHYGKFAEFELLARRGVPDYKIALRLDISRRTIQNYHKKLIARDEAG